MAVKMRLRRMGQKKAPFYRIIVADSRAPRDGRFIDEIGTYDPNCDPSAIKVDEEAAKKWLANGAQPTEAVAKILKAAGIGLREPFSLCEIEAIRQENGAPAYRFSGRTAEWVQARSLTARLSLSHEGGMALAFCTLETET